jgi:hypothetical protein
MAFSFCQAARLARGFVADGLVWLDFGQGRAQAADEEAHQPGVERLGVGVVDGPSRRRASAPEMA